MTNISENPDVGPDRKLEALNLLIQQFDAFWSSKGFRFERAVSALPEDGSTHDFLACNAMAFTSIYEGVVAPEQGRRKLARIQPSIRPSGGPKIGISPKHMTAFDMLGLFDFECSDPQALFNEILRFFAEELGIGYDSLSVNITPGNALGVAARETQKSQIALRVVEKSAESLKWAEVDGKSGFRAEINWMRPDGTEWELWNTSYVDGRILDSGGSLERVLAAKENANTVFDVGELAVIKSGLEGLLKGADDATIHFLADQIRTLKRVEADGVKPGGKGGRSLFARKVAENIISVSFVMGVNAREIFSTFDINGASEIANFDRKLRQVAGFLAREGDLTKGEIDLRTIFSDPFKAGNIQNLNLLKQPHVLIMLLLQAGCSIDLSSLPKSEMRSLWPQQPLLIDDLVDRQKPQAVINNLRKQIRAIDPNAAILLVGSRANNFIVKAGDIDLVVVSDRDGFASDLMNSIHGYSSTSDDSLRFDIDHQEVGIVPLSSAEFQTRITDVLEFKDLNLRYKPWALGAEVPEGFLGDMKKARLIQDRQDGFVTNLRRRIDQDSAAVHREIVLSSVTELVERVKQLGRQFQLGDSGEYGKSAAKVQIVFILLRMAYAKQETFFRGIKRIDQSILAKEPLIHQFLILLQNPEVTFPEIEEKFKTITQ